MANLNLNSCSFEFKVGNVTNLIVAASEVYYVRGQPWLIKVVKEELNQYKSLGIYLVCGKDDKSIHWGILATASIKLISSKLYMSPYQQVFKRRMFSCRKPYVCCNNFISWDALMFEENGFIVEDACTFEVNIKTGPLQSRNFDEQWLKMEIIRKCSDSCMGGKFRFTIRITRDFCQMLQWMVSPEFMLRNFPWRICVTKAENNKVPAESFLQFCLLNNFLNTESEWSCRTKLVCKLVSSVPCFSVEKMKIVEYSSKSAKSRLRSLNLISYRDFVNPTKNFIENQTIVIEAELTVIEVLCNNPERCRACELRCPICNKNLFPRTISSTRCGHVFCKKCIEKSLLKRQVCPVCYLETNKDELTSIFLPKSIY